MNSRQTIEKILGSTCVFVLAGFLVPAAAGSDTKTTKPAPSAPPPKSAPAPARPAQPVQQQPRVNPGGSPGFPSNGGAGGGVAKPAGGGGGITGAKPPGGGGGITGAKPTGGGGGITGVKPTGGAGGITGTVKPTGGGGGITGTVKPTGGSGGITGTVKPTGGAAGTTRASGGPAYHPPAGAKPTSLPGGGQSYVNSKTNTTVKTDPGGHVTSFERPGLRASNFRADGHPAHIERTLTGGGTMRVDRGLRGERRVEVVRPGGVRVVTVGRRGYVERPFRRGYISRTYMVNGRADVRVYRSYKYGSITYYNYVPRTYYRSAFYGWAYNPWAAPAAYTWGWTPVGWYGFYGGYFAPEPAYPNAALWLTDFLLAENLKQAYDDRMAAGGETPQAAGLADTAGALDPAVKQAIAEEVRQQLAADQAASQQPPDVNPPPSDASVPPSALKQHIFVVSTSLDVTATSGEGCALTPGDIIERTGREITPDGKLAVNVINSKVGDCPVDTASAIEVGALQDMHNQLREQMAAGLDNLAKDKGNGLPSAPAGAPRQVAEGQAPPDAQAQDLVSKQNQEADRADTEVQQGLTTGQ